METTMSDNVPKKRIPMDQEIYRILSEAVVRYPDYGHGSLIFSTDGTAQGSISYSNLISLGILRSDTIPAAPELPSSLVFAMNGWLHVDCRNDCSVSIDGMPVCRANSLIQSNLEYGYGTGIFPVKAGQTVTWNVPVATRYLALTFVPNVSV